MSRVATWILLVTAGALVGCGEHSRSNQAGLIGLLGPRTMGETMGTITSVELDVEFVHVETGSLEARLHYDADGDGTIDVTAPIEPHLAHWDGGTLPERWSCPATLDGVYRFRFSGAEETLTEEERAAVTCFVGTKPGGAFYFEVLVGGERARNAVRSWDVTVVCDDPAM